MTTHKKKNSRPRSGKSVGKNLPATNSLPKYRSGKKEQSESLSRKSILNELNPSYTISSRIRPIGNSNGVILPNRVIEEAGISPNADLIIQVSNGVIQIAEDKSPGRVNTDLSSWEVQFKNAIKMGNKPETDVWDGLQNQFDEEEWV